MRAAIVLALCAHLGFLAGCANSERYYGNVYEALKTREVLVHPSVEQKPPEKSMSYQEYEAGRKKLLESNAKE